MTQLKLILWGAALAAIVSIGSCVYLKGRSDATQKTDLATARAAIKESRERQKIEHATNTRVDAESTATQTVAKAADDEIERIRTKPDRAVPSSNKPAGIQTDPSHEAAARPDPNVVWSVDADGARVMQLAREARAAALESSARLQSARAGAR